MKYSQWQITRRKPYTEAGIKRLPCIRCGGKAKYQWQICSDGSNYRPICEPCDIALNREVLKFMRHPHWRQVSEEYADNQHYFKDVIHK